MPWFPGGENGGNGFFVAPSEAGAIEAYIFHNYIHLFTKEEKATYNTIIEGRPCGHEKAVALLLKNSEMAFDHDTVKRIVEEHKGKIIYNRCPWTAVAELGRSGKALNHCTYLRETSFLLKDRE